MGKRGPPPLPTEIKKARGTHQKCRDAPNAVTAPPGAPRRPAGLNRVARAKWDELVPRLLELRVLSVLDGQALESYCRAFAVWRKFQALAEAEPIVETVFGPKVNPAAVAAVKWSGVLKEWGDRLGLSPSSRTRVSGAGGAGGKKDDPREKARAFLFGQRGAAAGAPGGPALTALPGGKAGSGA